MISISIQSMRRYLSKSIRRIDGNKLNNMLAEMEFRDYLKKLGFGDQVSIGGWMFRCDGQRQFGHHTLVCFPETINPENNYSVNRNLPVPDFGLHTLCSTFNQAGFQTYFCAPQIAEHDEVNSIDWFIIQIGLPKEESYVPLSNAIPSFNKRRRNYNWLTGSSDISLIPDHGVPETFSKEHFRVSFQDNFMSEISGFDGIFRGNQFTYCLELKEMTMSTGNRVGECFEIEVGSFVKLAFYARRGNFRSIFVVREMDNEPDNNLLNWWYITFEKMSQFASWNPRGGGENIPGGQVTTIIIPKSEFVELNASSLQLL